jgi:hypothetical protein
MAKSRVPSLTVVEREREHVVLGEITLEDMLVARRRHLEEETRRERPLPLRAILAPWRWRAKPS